MTDNRDMYSVIKAHYADQLGIDSYDQLRKLDEDSLMLTDAIETQNFSMIEKRLRFLANETYINPVHRLTNHFGLYLLALCEMSRTPDVEAFTEALSDWLQREYVSFYTCFARAVWDSLTLRADIKVLLRNTLLRGFDITQLPHRVFTRRLTKAGLTPVDLLDDAQDSVTTNFLLRMMSYQPPEDVGFLF